MAVATVKACLPWEVPIDLPWAGRRGAESSSFRIGDSFTSGFPLEATIKAMDYYFGFSGSQPSAREQEEFARFALETSAGLHQRYSETGDSDLEPLIAGIDYVTNRADSAPTAADEAKFFGFALRLRARLVTYLERMHKITGLDIFTPS